MADEIVVKSGAMSTERTREALNKLIKSFHVYYDVNMEDPLPPFSAEATFRLHDEQYVFIKKAKVSEIDSTEYMYFAEAGDLTAEQYQLFDDVSWQDGLKRADPKPNHRNTDVTLVIIAEEIGPEVAQIIKKAKHHVSYKFSFHGWSTYRVVAYDLSKGTVLYNRRGQELKKIFRNIRL